MYRSRTTLYRMTWAACAGITCFLFAGFIATRLSAQTFYGSIVGIVTDSSAAPVEGAEVAVVNTGTGDRRTAETDASGNYRMVDLLPGLYRLDIQKTGFKHVTHDELKVDVEGVLRIDVPLEVGNLNETVEVTAQTSLLQTETTSLSQVVEGRAVNETPLNGRNVVNLVSLVPGVVPQGSFSGSAVGNQNAGTSTNNFGWGNFQAGGGMANQSSVYLDGTPLNGPESNIMALVPTQDAIQEFRIATSNVSPEFGRFAGAVVNMTTKSGTNQFHGGVYEFLRNKLLNANNFFNNKTDTPRPAFTQNQYGVNLGGPVRRDKLFFFFSREDFSQRQGSPTTTTVPTAAMNAGNFSAAGIPVIYDPLTNPRVPFAGNIIPASRIDPTANVMTRLYWGAPNQPGILNNWTSNVNAGGDSVQYNGRGDYNVSDKQRLFVRYTYWNTDPVRHDLFHNIAAGSEIKPGTQQAAGGDTYTLGPNTVAEVRLGYWRHYYDEFPPDHGGVNESQFGPAYAQLAPSMTYSLIPGVNITGFFNVGDLDGFGVNDIFTSSGSITRTAGRHTLKFGGEVRRDEFYFGQLSAPALASGDLTFDAGWTQQSPSARVGGYPYASFMLGYASSGTIATLHRPSDVMIYQGYYVADNWQVSKKLTVTDGLRWELPGVYAEKKNNDTVLQPNAVDPLAQQTGLPLAGGLALVASPQYPDRHNNERHWTLFAPRLGLAYRYDDKTVIRTGYGITYAPSAGASPQNSPINIASTFMLTSVDGNVTPYNTLSNPFPNGILQPPLRNPAAFSSLEGSAISGAIPNSRFPYVQQWNFNIQRELLSGTVIEIGYAGSKGTHLSGGQAGIDQLPIQDLSLGTALSAPVKNPFAGLLPVSSTLDAATIPAGQLLRPYPQFTNVTITGPTNGDSIYHSLQASAQRRFRGGGNLLIGYTWSKFLSDADTGTSFLDSGTGTGVVQDSSNLHNSRSLVSYDVPQRLVVSYTIDLPFGKGKRFLGQVTGVADHLISGWGVNGVSVFQSGLPLVFTSAATTQISSFGFGTLRPNVVAGCQKTVSGDLKNNLSEAFNTACYTAPSPYGLGDESRTDPNLRSAGQANWDFSIFKNTAITERVHLQFRAEFFNLFNRVQLGEPGTVIGNPQFGIISSQLNLPRLIQAALRLNF